MCQCGSDRSAGPDPGLQSFFSSTGHYALLDNHELGNKQVINGGAPAGTNPVGIGVNATNPANDVNTTGTALTASSPMSCSCWFGKLEQNAGVETAPLLCCYRPLRLLDLPRRPHGVAGP
jgi:hypothetical protein